MPAADSATNNAWQEQANKIIMLMENANAEYPR
jgi:hypothetical protein